MSRRPVMVVAAVLFLLGAAIRVHNALTFPVLGSYDAFGHFTYVWYLAETWRVPLPTAGWGFFHPPLYYAAMAAIWSALPELDPIARLRVGIVALAIASLVHAFVVWDLLRRRFPEDLTLRVLAAGLMLLLPVHLYGAAFLGNESLTALLCSVAFWLLLAQARRPTWTRTALLGLVLGLAMLTKATAIALVAAALGTLGWKAWRERVPRIAAQLALTLAIVLTTCGWYYARNLERYGTPLVMSREQLMVRMVESSHPQARRALAEYLLFDPTIFRRPAWPRSGGDAPEPEGLARALRDSVWTGLYANAWFDGFGGWTVPRVTDSELARRCGQALLVLGIVPTLLVLAGVFAALARLRRQGWDDLLGASLLALGGMIVIFVIGTRAAPIAAAVKATYFTPVAAAFGVCFALGLARLRARLPAAVALVAVELAVTGALAAVVFWHGLLFDARTIRGYFPLIDATEANLYGVVAYAGGERDTAQRLFAEAAREGLYLGYENLAVLALDSGRPAEALHLVKRALRLQPAQSFGLAADRADYDRVTRAEHLNLVAVIARELGRPTRARRAAAAALGLDPTLPEAHYDLAVAILDAAGSDAVPATAEVAEACRHLARALTLDPGFGEARALLAATRSSACAATALPPPTSRRIYPVETGVGAPHAASIGRRRHAAPRAADAPTPPGQSQT